MTIQFAGMIHLGVLVGPYRESKESVFCDFFVELALAVPYRVSLSIASDYMTMRHC